MSTRPFLRVATAASEARKAGREFSARDVDDEASSALVHVVMNVVEPGGGLTESDALKMEVIPRLESRLVGSPEGVRAAWVKVVLDRSEPDLVGCSKCGVVIGAFERGQLCGGCYVFVYRMRRDGGHKLSVANGALISETDVNNWR